MVNEIRIMRSLKLCGNVLRLHKIYESDHYINLLMDYQEGGTLSSILSKKERVLSEDDIRLIMEQLLLTLDFMALKNIIHRDLKPDNILLSSKA